MITIHKASSVSELSQKRPRKQQQHHSSLPTLHKACPSQAPYQRAKGTRYCQYKALRMTGPYFINTIKSNQNVHLESNGQAKQSDIHAKQVKASHVNQWHMPKAKSQVAKQPSASHWKGCKALSNHFKKPRCRPLLVEGLSGGSACDGA